MDASALAFGHLIEGVVELDPGTGRHVIRTDDGAGRTTTFDIEQAIAQLSGKAVRLTLASLEDISKLAELVEAAMAADTRTNG